MNRLVMGKLETVMSMKNSKEILSSIMRTTQKGQAGIRSVLQVPVQATLRSALESQLDEYRSIEQEARAIASSRGWVLEELDPAFPHILALLSRLRFTFGDTDYKAAAMTITGNTKGIIKGMHELRQFNHRDERISLLSQKLLDCEHANIRQMQGFL